jgi:hypothetical protein
MMDGDPLHGHELHGLKHAMTDLTRRRADLAGGIVRIQAELDSIRINRRNAVRALRHPFFKRRESALLNFLIDRVAQPVVAQAQMNLASHKEVRERAAIHFQSLEASVQMLGARRSHDLEFLMAFIGAVSATAVLPTLCGKLFSELDWYTRSVLVFVPMAAILLAAWWFIGRRSRRHASRHRHRSV